MASKLAGSRVVRLVDEWYGKVWHGPSDGREWLTSTKRMPLCRRRAGV